MISCDLLNFIFHCVLSRKISPSAAHLSYSVIGSVQPGYNRLLTLNDSFFGYYYFCKYCTNASLELNEPALKDGNQSGLKDTPAAENK